MSRSDEDIPETEIKRTERLTFALLSQSYEANMKIILDDRHPILTRIKALKSAEFAIQCSSASEVFPDDDVNIEASPDIGDYFKALITIAKERMSAKDAFTVLKHVYAAINHRLILDMHVEADDKYDAISVPFFAEICSTTIKTFIEFRDNPDIVSKCHYIFQHIFLGKDFLEERRKCGDIAVASGLIPTLANMMTSHSVYGAFGDAAPSDELCVGALDILLKLLALKWSEPPVSILLETAHPVFHCLLNSETEIIMSRGISVISKFLSIAEKKTIDLKFKNGKTGVQYILLVIEHYLKLMKTQGRGKELMTYDVLEIIEHLAELILHREDLNMLSKIMLNMLEDEYCKTIHKRLLLTFADLMYSKCEEVLDCLSDQPAGSTSGQNYMRDVIVRGFCGGYESFQHGARETVKLALLDIYYYGVDADDEDSKLPKEIFEAVQAHLSSLSVGNDGGKI